MLAEYLSKEPSPTERLEYMVAHGAAIYVNANRGKGKAPHKIADFMLFADAWKQESEPELSFAGFAAAMGANRKR